MIVLLLFAMQGMDVTNPINPKPSNKYQFILVAVDSFIEWIKATSYVYVTQKVVQRVFEKRYYFWYGFLEALVTGNAHDFNGKMIQELCQW